jgi:transcriptional regulator with XRE-family HTH domain
LTGMSQASETPVLDCRTEAGEFSLQASSTADFARFIAAARRRRQFTQRDLARLARVSQPWIATVERGKVRMDLMLVLRVLAALNVRITLQVESGHDEEFRQP